LFKKKIKVARLNGSHLLIPATQQAEIGSILVHDQPRQNVSKTPPSTDNLGTVVHTCHPSYVGDIGRRSVVQGEPWQKCKTLSEK
jgi:hypothetical protein